MEITAPKNDGGCDGISDGPKPSRCSDLKGGCKSFIVCDENDCKYEKGKLPEETTSEDNDVETNKGDTGDTGSEDNADTSS